MHIAAEQQQQASVPLTVVLVVLVIGGVIYTLGYLRAVFHRSNSDYKKVKAGLPGMRKDVWRSGWAVVKIGFWVVVAAAILVMWTWRDIRDDDPQKPVPAQVSQPARR